jgi:hypothetical protein
METKFGDRPESISPSVETSAEVAEDSASTESTFSWISSFSDTYRFFAYSQELA